MHDAEVVVPEDVAHVRLLLEAHAVLEVDDREGRVGRRYARRAQADRWIQESAEPSQLLADAECVDAALVFAYRSVRQDACIANEWVADACGRSRGRLFGIAGIDPMSPDAFSELDRAVDMGFVGITVCPSDQGFHPTNSTAMQLWERCDHLGFPVFSSRPGPPCPGAIIEFDRPCNWDEVARSFPGMTIVLGGLGFPWVDEALLMMQKHPRFFADTGGLVSSPWQLYQTLLSATSLGVPISPASSAGTADEQDRRHESSKIICIEGPGIGVLPKKCKAKYEVYMYHGVCTIPRILKIGRAHV